MNLQDTTTKKDPYWILNSERNRTQSFQWDFTPEIIKWLPLGAKFNSNYNHSRVDQNQPIPGGTTIPEHFGANTKHDIRFNSGIRLPTLLSSLEKSLKSVKWLSGGVGSTKKGLDKLKLRNIDANYVVSHSYNQEKFNLDTIANRDIDNWEFLAYQLGMVYNPQVMINYDKFKREVILGQPDANFFDYLTRPMVDTLSPGNMNHAISRTADIRSGFTIPILDIGLTGTLKWTKGYTLHRNYQLMSSADTSVTWPDFSIQGRISNFARKFGFVKKYFRNMSANTSYRYAIEEKFNLFNSIQSTTVSHVFSPLIKLSATGKNNIRYENYINTNRSHVNRLTKAALQNKDGGPVNFWVPSYNDSPIERDSLPGYNEKRRLGTTSEDKIFGISDIFTLSYDVQTKKGIQLWRWYIKLENNLRLKLQLETGWSEKIHFDEGDRFPESEEWSSKIRPEMSYNFTRMIDVLFYMQYLRMQEFHTEDEEVTHEIEVHGEFTMRF